MNNRLRRFLKYALCAGIFILVFTAIGTGDVGNFNDYSGGGSGWSSSSSGSSSWSGGSSSSSSDASGDLFLYLFILFWQSGPVGKVIILIVLYIFAWHILKKGPTRKTAMPARELRWPTLPDHTPDITRALQETDPAFNATAFLEWAKEIFFNLQTAWMERDWDKVRPFESEELFAQHERQLQEYKRLGRINILERININNAYFFSLTQDKNFETLSVVMHVRMIDYIIDEHTRQVLKGDPNTDYFLSYFYVFKRKAGIQTVSAKQQTDTIACPHCGAPTHVVSSGKCEYCNFVITVKEHGWVLADIIGIKPPYNYGPGGVISQTNPEEK